MSQDNVLKGTLRGLALVSAYILVEPLSKEITDTFGSAILYHPVTVWLTLFCLTYVNTESYKAGLSVVVFYEAVKLIWRVIQPPVPKIVKVRKLISRVQNNDELSASDLLFINEITPENVRLYKDGELVK